jgi:hypothetical protein
MNILLNQFPERMGHAIVYQAPWIFNSFWKLVSPFMDARTKSKIIFVRGDDKDGGAVDKQLREIIGDDWKAVTGAGHEVGLLTSQM